MTAEAGIGKTRFAAEVERFAAGYDVGTGRYAAHTGARVLSVQLRARSASAAGSRRWPTWSATRSACPRDVGRRGRPGAVVEERLRRLGQRLGPRPAATPARRPSTCCWRCSATARRRPTRSARPPAPTGRPPAGSRRRTPRPSRRRSPTCSPRWPPRRRWWSIVDDLHDATAETVDALGGTLSRLTGPVVVLLLGRPELVRTAGALTRLADAEVHTLPPLRGADAARLLTSYLDGGKLPQADADRLLATAQGNPFYLAELVTLLMERGALTPRRSAPTRPAKWQLAAGSLGSQLLSRDLAAVLAARIDALPAEPRAVLRDAAVVGDTVPAGVVEALRERRAGQRRPARRGGRGRAGTRRRRTAATAHAAPGPRRVRVQPRR